MRRFVERWPLIAALLACLLGGFAAACGDTSPPTDAQVSRLHVTVGSRKEEFGDPYAQPIDGIDIIEKPDNPWGPCGVGGCGPDEGCSIDPWGCGHDTPPNPTDPNDPSGSAGTNPPPPPPSTSDKDLDATPDCSKPQAKATLAAYCRGLTPDAVQTSRILNALAAMRALGGPCVALADLGTQLLVAGRIRIYSPVSTDDFSGAAPLGGALPANGGPAGPNSWLISDATWVDYYYDASHHTTVTSTEKYQRNLQNDLAHELDHLLGRDHIDAAGWKTANSRACSGLP